MSQNRIIILIFTILIIVSISPAIFPSRPINLDLQTELEPKEIYNNSINSIVEVIAYDSKGFSYNRGTGFIIQTDGIILTNYHIIKDAEKSSISFKNGKEVFVTSILDFNSEIDFAILKIEENNLSFLTIGNSDKVEIGDLVYTIGNPQGFNFTLSNGIVSNISDGNTIMQKAGYSRFGNLMQTTAAISGGSSGGPLLNTYGQVIAIIRGSYSGQNLNICVPIKTIINYSRWSIG